MTTPVKVGMVQINNSFSGQNYLPLSIGMLQAYAQKKLQRPQDYEFLLPIYSRLAVDEAVERLSDADIALFSTYVWNFRISLEIAQRLKQRKPEIVTVFGGPHVPDRPEQDQQFMKNYQFIDVACHGEGEQITVQILERVHPAAGGTPPSGLRTRDWASVPSISFRNGRGEHVRTAKGPKLGDLNQVPSPYLEGVFVPLMDANPNEHWIGLWETNRGCPFSCAFCDWGSATQSKVSAFDVERLFREVDWFAEHRVEYIFCCDANFGMLPRDLDIARYVADVKRSRGYPHALSVQNTKNATERAYQVQKTLSDNGLNKGVDIALQSVDPTTLNSIKRGNISTDTYQELQRRFTRDNIETYTDLILGLPGETYDSFARGVDSIMNNGQHNRIQFNNLSILPNAEMGDPEYQKLHGMVMVETKVVNIHGSLTESPEEVYETQELVIATASMPKADWVRTRVFSWMAALLHFNKLMQIPFIVAHEVCQVGYRELIELFLEGDLRDSPIIASMGEFFRAKARDIQAGGQEYVQSKEWLDIWWPADEYMFIKLSAEGTLPAFYREAEALIERFLREKFLTLPPGLLGEAIELNSKLIKQPFQTTNLTLDVSYSIWEFYQSARKGLNIPLEQKPSCYEIDRTTKTWNSWDVWCREVVWWGNKKGAYLYTNNVIEPQLAGHF